MEGCLGSLSKGGKGWDQFDQFCIDSNENIVEKATYFHHEETKTQINYLTSFCLEDAIGKDRIRKHFFSEVQLHSSLLDSSLH